MAIRSLFFLKRCREYSPNIFTPLSPSIFRQYITCLNVALWYQIGNRLKMVTGSIYRLHLSHRADNLFKLRLFHISMCLYARTSAIYRINQVGFCFVFVFILKLGRVVFLSNAHFKDLLHMRQQNKHPYQMKETPAINL